MTFNISWIAPKTKFDILAISETRITKQVPSLNNLNINNYSSEFTPTETLQRLLNCTKTKFDIIAIIETRITKQVLSLNNLDLNNYSSESTPTETSAGGNLLQIANHLWYKCCNDLKIFKKINLDLLLLKL